MLYIVTKSPWPTHLPSGTKIIKVETPKGKEGDWFKREDNTPLQLERNSPDPVFKLWHGEFEEIKQS